MSSTNPAPADSTSHKRCDDGHTLQRQKTIEQAIAEGHDADIPSGIGYVLDEAGETRRRQSIADQRRPSLAKKPSLSGSHTSASHDVEKDAGTGGETASDTRDEPGTDDDDNDP